MTELQQNRYDQLIRRVGGLIGPGSKVSEVLSELFPMIDVENVPGELLRLAGTRLCYGGGSIAGVAAESARGQLFNPADSGHLVIITSIFFGTAGDTVLRWGSNTVALSVALSTQLFRDTRDLSPIRPIAEVRSDSTVALAEGTNQARLLAISTLKLSDPNGVVVLAPGTGFEIGAVTQNNAINFSFNWRERVAEVSELNL